MRTLKRLGAVLGLYIAFVVVFETGYLGLYQPSFEESGIPMLLLTTTDADGEADSRMLARFETATVNVQPPRASAKASLRLASQRELARSRQREPSLEYLDSKLEREPGEL